MEKIKEEKSLVVIDNSIFGRIRRFWTNIFSKKNNIFQNDYEDEVVEEEINEEENEQKKKPKLFNYDDPQNFYNINENMVGEENSMKSSENNEENVNDENGVNRYFEDEAKNDDNYQVNDEIQQKLINYYESIKKSIKANQ